MKDLFNNRTQSCWRERLQKEMRTRLAWKIKYSQDYPGVGVPSVRKRREAPAVVKPALPVISVPKAQTAEEKEKEKAKTQAQTQTQAKAQPQTHAKAQPQTQAKAQAQARELSAKIQEFSLDMRPASSRSLKLLYQGLSEEGSGRQQYLQRRKLKNPEEKYQYRMLSSWDYGWHIGDVMKEFKAPAYGRSRIVKETFYKKNGISWEPSKTDKLL